MDWRAAVRWWEGSNAAQPRGKTHSWPGVYARRR